MGADQHIDWPGAAASTLAWWDEAGVDTLVGDAPRNWLIAEAHGAPQAAAIAPAAPNAVRLPETLAAFLDWRTGIDAPDAAWGGAAVRFAGPARSSLMVLLDCPDRDDIAADCLLGGAAGRLFDRMLAAIGLDRSGIHIAALCARRPTAGRIPADSEAALAAAARHHLALVAPRRLLVMGGATSRALLKIDGVRARGILHDVNHAGGTVPAIVTYHPRFLLEKPMAKAEAWRDLQLLKRGMV